MWAINNIGRLYQNGLGVPVDEALAAQWFRAAAEGGNPVAQYNLGSLYVRGRGVPQSNRDAHYWWSVALRGDLADDVRDDVKHDLRLVESELSSADLEESRRLAKAWQPKAPTQLPRN